LDEGVVAVWVTNLPQVVYLKTLPDVSLLEVSPETGSAVAASVAVTVGLTVVVTVTVVVE